MEHKDRGVFIPAEVSQRVQQTNCYRHCSRNYQLLTKILTRCRAIYTTPYKTKPFTFSSKPITNPKRPEQGKSRFKKKKKIQKRSISAYT